MGQRSTNVISDALASVWYVTRILLKGEDLNRSLKAEMLKLEDVVRELGGSSNVSQTGVWGRCLQSPVAIGDEGIWWAIFWEK